MARLYVVLLDDEQPMLDLWGYLFECMGIKDFWAPNATMRRARTDRWPECDCVAVFSPKEARSVKGEIPLTQFSGTAPDQDMLLVFGHTNGVLDEATLEEAGIRPTHRVYIPSDNGTELHAPMAGAIALWKLLNG